MAEKLFAIETSGTGELQYTFRVDGSVRKAEKNADVTSVGESNDTLEPTNTGYNVSGSTGNGFGDAYMVNGTITEWSANSSVSDYTLLLGGSQVSPDAFPVSTTPNRDPTVSISELNVSQDQVSASATANDPEGSLKDISWSLYRQGESAPLSTKSGQTVMFVLPSAGSYTLGVTATDTEEATGTATTTFNTRDDSEDRASSIGINKRTLAIGAAAFGAAYVFAGRD